MLRVAFIYIYSGEYQNPVYKTEVTPEVEPEEVLVDDKLGVDDLY